MRRGVMRAGILGAVLGLGSRAVARAADPPPAGPGAVAVPPALAPFEHMIGAWKGTAIPAANRLKGWPERHRWAWKFAQGRVAGLAVTMEGDKALSRAVLTHDPARGLYRLEGTDPAGQPVAFVGPMDRRGLVLERQGDSPRGQERLILRPLENKIRYVLEDDVREAGAPQYDRAIEVGLTKEGEAFAAGGSAADLPKCIITGGGATMTVTYKGITYPICCSGCRDEFQDDPETYVRKAALRARAGAGTSPASATTGLRRDDGAFAGFGDDAPARPTPAPALAPAPTSRPRPEPPAATPSPPEPAPAPAPSPAAKSEGPSAEEKAARLLRLGQTLEKARRYEGAAEYYREVVKGYPTTPQARTAAARLKAMGK